MTLDRSTLIRFVRFCLVGASGVVVDMGVLYMLADSTKLGWPVPLAKACAVEVAIVNNFLWNDRWTFGDVAREERGLRQGLKRFGSFNLICLMGLLIGVVVLTGLREGLGVNLYMANLIAIGAATGWNFGANQRFTWLER